MYISQVCESIVFHISTSPTSCLPRLPPAAAAAVEAGTGQQHSIQQQQQKGNQTHIGISIS
jgi:hypothetical protein